MTGHVTAPAAALADRLPEWVTLLRAPNPGPMTLEGTNTWVLREPGSGTRATTESYLTGLDLTPAQLTLSSNAAVCESVAVGRPFGTDEARAGRKMGHLAAVGDSPADALARVQRAAARRRSGRLPRRWRPVRRLPGHLRSFLRRPLFRRLLLRYLNRAGPESR